MKKLIFLLIMNFIHSSESLNSSLKTTNQDIFYYNIFDYLLYINNKYSNIDNNEILEFYFNLVLFCYDYCFDENYNNEFYISKEGYIIRNINKLLINISNINKIVVFFMNNILTPEEKNDHNIIYKILKIMPNILEVSNNNKQFITDNFGNKSIFLGFDFKTKKNSKENQEIFNSLENLKLLFEKKNIKENIISINVQNLKLSLISLENYCKFQKIKTKKNFSWIYLYNFDDYFNIVNNEYFDDYFNIVNDEYSGSIMEELQPLKKLTFIKKIKNIGSSIFNPIMKKIKKSSSKNQEESQNYIELQPLKKDIVKSSFAFLDKNRVSIVENLKDLHSKTIIQDIKKINRIDIYSINSIIQEPNIIQDEIKYGAMGNPEDMDPIIEQHKIQDEIKYGAMGNPDDISKISMDPVIEQHIIQDESIQNPEVKLKNPEDKLKKPMDPIIEQHIIQYEAMGNPEDISKISMDKMMLNSRDISKISMDPIIKQPKIQDEIQYEAMGNPEDISKISMDPIIEQHIIQDEIQNESIKNPEDMLKISMDPIIEQHIIQDEIKYGAIVNPDIEIIKNNINKSNEETLQYLPLLILGILIIIGISLGIYFLKIKNKTNNKFKKTKKVKINNGNNNKKTKKINKNQNKNLV
jgi:hypothetical protein